MSEPTLTEAQLRDLGPWNSRLLEREVARMIAKARAEGYKAGHEDAREEALGLDA